MLCENVAKVTTYVTNAYDVMCKCIYKKVIMWQICMLKKCSSFVVVLITFSLQLINVMFQCSYKMYIKNVHQECTFLCEKLMYIDDKHYLSKIM